MKRRCGLLLLVALWAGASGCSSTARRTDGSPIFGPRAWYEAPAPAQKLVAASPGQPAVAEEPAARPEGLAKYFPGLQRTKSEPPKVASRYRPTWFGLRPDPSKVVGTQTYMTDARAGLNRPGAEPSTLPVALQVPIERASADRAVMTTNVETTLPSTTSPEIPDFGGKPSRPGEDEVNPLPPAAEPAPSAAAVDRMPEVPAIDPLERARRMEPVTNPGPPDVPTADEKAVKATTSTANSDRPSDSPDSAHPVSYSTSPTTQAADAAKAPAPGATVYASPQGPAPKPHVHVHVKPTSKVKPSPQSAAIPAWKNNPFCRTIRKVCKLGEYANPPH